MEIVKTESVDPAPMILVYNIPHSLNKKNEKEWRTRRVGSACEIKSTGPCRVSLGAPEPALSVVEGFRVAERELTWVRSK